jgi:hypothetical protein
LKAAEGGTKEGTIAEFLRMPIDMRRYGLPDAEFELAAQRPLPGCDIFMSAVATVLTLEAGATIIRVHALAED